MWLRPCLPSRLLPAFLCPLLPTGVLSLSLSSVEILCPLLPAAVLIYSLVLVCFVELSVAALLLLYA